MQDPDNSPEVKDRPVNIGIRDWFPLATGLNLAFAISYLACTPPQAHAHAWPAALSLSLFYLFLACVVGAFGTWLMLPAGSWRLASLFRLGLRAWIFFPAIALTGLWMWKGHVATRRSSKRSA